MALARFQQHLQFIDADGNPLSGGSLELYLAGTTTHATAYKDPDGQAAWTWPIPMGATGCPDIWVDEDGTYKYIAKDADDATIETRDYISCAAGGGGGGLSEVAHDSTLTGAGTTASPLSVVGGGYDPTETDPGQIYYDRGVSMTTKKMDYYPYNSIGITKMVTGSTTYGIGSMYTSDREDHVITQVIIEGVCMDCSVASQADPTTDLTIKFYNKAGTQTGSYVTSTSLSQDMRHYILTLPNAITANHIELSATAGNSAVAKVWKDSSTGYVAGAFIYDESDAQTPNKLVGISYGNGYPVATSEDVTGKLYLCLSSGQLFAGSGTTWTGVVSGGSGALTSIAHDTTMTGTGSSASPLSCQTYVQAQVAAEATLRSDADTAEATARSDADTALGTRIDSEATTRADADTQLQTNITAEATTRANADTTLQTNIDSEATTRANADTTLQTNIDAEATTRGNADTALGTSISNEVTRATGIEAGLRTDVDAKLSSVSVDGTTITGDGTASNPLVAHSSGGLTEVSHDDTLTGSGTTASPLGNALIHAGGGTKSAWVGSNVSGFYSGMGTNAFAEGYNTRAFGEDSHAEGKQTLASALGAHVEGYSNTASGQYQHVEGFGNTSSASTDDWGQHVGGKYNVSASGAEVIGGGSSSTSKNIRVLDWSGKESTRGIDSLNTDLGSSTPTFVGETYRDTTTNHIYVAVGTSSTSDWVDITSTSGGGTVTTDATLTGDGSSSSPLSVARMTNGSGSNAVQFGYGGTANGDYSIAAGKNCTCTGKQAFVTGTQNTTTSTGSNSIVSGSSNSCAGGSSIVTGANNEVTADNCNAIIGGRYNVNTRGNQVVLGGTYNVSTSGATVVSGIGDSTARKNGFELMNTGCVKSRGIDSLNTDLGSTTPTFVGETYRDTTTNHIYVATGTSSSSDWVDLMGSSSGLTEVTHDSTLSGLGTSASPLSVVGGGSGVSSNYVDAGDAMVRGSVARGGNCDAQDNSGTSTADVAANVLIGCQVGSTFYTGYIGTWTPHIYCSESGKLFKFGVATWSQYGGSSLTNKTQLGVFRMPGAGEDWVTLPIKKATSLFAGPNVLYIEPVTADSTVTVTCNNASSVTSGNAVMWSDCYSYSMSSGSRIASLEYIDGEVDFVYGDTATYPTKWLDNGNVASELYPATATGTGDISGRMWVHNPTGNTPYLYIGVGTTWKQIAFDA